MPTRMVKAIIPPKLKNFAAQQAFNEAIKPIEYEVVKDFERCTATWKQRPVFRSIQSGGFSFFGDVTDLAIQIWTTDERFGWVDEGTRPHIIRPKPGRGPKARLRFKPGFRAKSQPNSLGSFAGQTWGTPVFAREVHHPGTKARNFTKTIMKKREPWIWGRIQQAMLDAVKAGGHGL